MLRALNSCCLLIFLMRHVVDVAILVIFGGQVVLIYKCIDGSLPSCIAFYGPEERLLPWSQQVPETSHVDLEHAYGERVCGWSILSSMRKQFLNRSRHKAKVIASSFRKQLAVSKDISDIALNSINWAQVPTDHCIGLPGPSLAKSKDADVVPVKCRSEDWLHVMEHIICIINKIRLTLEKDGCAVRR